MFFNRGFAALPILIFIAAAVVSLTGYFLIVAKKATTPDRGTISDVIFVFGEEAIKLCGSEPPAICPAEERLGCRQADKKWGCHLVIDSTVDV